MMPHGLGFADVDVDGRRDVLSIDAWWRAPVQAGGAWEEHLADLGAPAAQMYAFDADGDGDRDVVASSAHDYGLWWYEQARDSAGATRWIRHTIDDRVSVMHALAATDLDRDGTMDLVTGKRFLAHNGNDPGEYDPSVLLWYRGGKDAAGRPIWTPDRHPRRDRRRAAGHRDVEQEGGLPVRAPALTSPWPRAAEGNASSTIRIAFSR
jgi:hypothetical protein